jgi:hypothetical protein
MKKSNWFVPGLISVGIVLILLSIWSPQNKFSFSKSNFAKLVERSGVVKIQNNEMPAEVQVKPGYSIEVRDVLRTEADSEGVVEFNGGGQFRIGPDSEVLLDAHENGSPVVVVRTGEIFVEKFGKPEQGFWVRSEGQLYSAVDYVLIDKRNAAKLSEAIPSQAASEQLTQVEIENTLNAKRTDFFKCFGQLIQRNPQAAGSVLISFTIERQGFPSKVEISKTEIADSSFRSCLVEVVSRTKFRAFAGNAITTVFPLRFE